MDKSILDLRLGKVAKEILKTKTEKMVSHHKRINIDHVTSDVTLYCILIMTNENKSSKKKIAFWSDRSINPLEVFWQSFVNEWFLDS